jgi:hypothetical protein
VGLLGRLVDGDGPATDMKGLTKKLAESNSLWAPAYFLLLPVYILAFGLAFSVRRDSILSLVRFVERNGLLSVAIGLILLSASILSFYYFLKSYYVYPKDARRKLPLYAPCLGFLGSFIGILVVLSTDYRITARMAEWDWAAVLVGLAFAFVYTILAPPLKDLSQKSPILRQIIFDKGTGSFVSAHRKMRVEAEMQGDRFHNMKFIATPDEQERMRGCVLECQNAMDGLISHEKNRRLRSRYEKTAEDLRIVARLLDCLKGCPVDYTRFIAEDIVLETLVPGIKDKRARFRRMLHLDY